MPVAVEIGLRDGGILQGVRGVKASPGTWVLPGGTGAVYRAGSNQIRFGPGAAPHESVQVRGAEPPLPGERVYLTGYTPFDRTLGFECT